MVAGLHVHTFKALSLVRMVKSVYVPSFLICQKFSACLEENSFVRGNGNASAAAMSEVKIVTISYLHLLYWLIPSMLRLHYTDLGKTTQCTITVPASAAIRCMSRKYQVMCVFNLTLVTSYVKKVMFLVVLVCLFVCLSVCKQHYSKSAGRIAMKFYGTVWGGTMNKRINFGW